MIEEIEKCLIKYQPDHLMLYGDTNSTLAGAIAATKLNISILHVEAGLRSYNRKQPEEKNRVITDYLSEICFAPTDIAVENLKKENIHIDRIFKCGDVMTDVLRIFKKKIDSEYEIINQLNLNNSKYCVVTIHREENTMHKEVLKNILIALNGIDLPIVLPLHPRTRIKFKEFNLEKYLKKFKICEPLNYFEMIKLTKDSALIITDSGGLQKEAYINKVPCLTLRENTEWVESVESGWNFLANPSNYDYIIKGMHRQLNMDKNLDHPHYYGDGYASQEIVEHIKKIF